MARKKDEGVTVDDGRAPILEAAEHLGAGAPIAPAHGLAAMALGMAVKYHDIATIQDGALYQQYKLEGRNLQTLHLDMVFETAMRMEAFLISAPSRLANMIVEDFSKAAVTVLEGVLDAEELDAIPDPEEHKE